MQNAEPPPLVVVAPDDRWPEAWKARGLGVDAVALGGERLPKVWRVSGHAAPIPELPGFSEGGFWVQDAASVAVADAVGAGPGDEVLDACAAPGGKAFRLASRGAAVTAMDRDEARLAMVHQSAARLGLTIGTQRHDWERASSGERTWPFILVDAPCSALGILRRHPEIRWRREADDLPAIARRQAKILDHAASQLAPGGRLVYAVCSPEPEEGPEVVRGFLARHPAFHLETERSTAPPEHHEDAFYFARLSVDAR
jgi:16S rRNA (cytosine967-C5)-methyltransferase